MKMQRKFLAFCKKYQVAVLHILCVSQQHSRSVFRLIRPTEFNVLKSGNNSSSGVSASFGGTALFTTPGARPFDVVALSVGSASSRYSDYSSKSLDALSAQAFYQFYIDGHGYDLKNQLLDVSPTINSNKIPPNLLTYDFLALGVQNQTAFSPTYNSEIANLLTPQVTLGRQNINLDSNKPRGCSPYIDDPTKYGFCNYLNLTLTVGQTFSDVITQQNANISATGTLGWRINGTDLTVALQTAVTGRTYEDFAGGRQDLLLQGGPVLTFTPSKQITFSLPVTYYQNYSTVAKAAWAGVIVQPTLTVAFVPYTAPVLR